jgi:hypothetical protein
MATTITLPVGKNFFAWIGPTIAINSNNFSWYTTANVSAIYAISSSRLGYISAKPTSNFPAVTQFVLAPTGSVPYIYEIDLKQPITLDSSQIYVLGTITSTPTNPGTPSTTDIVELLPVSYANESNTGFGSTMGDASVVRQQDYTTALSATSGGQLTADLGAACVISGVLLAPRLGENIGAQYESESMGAVLLGANQALTSPTDAAGATLLTVPTTRWPENFELTRFATSSTTPYRYVLFGKGSAFSFSEFRLLGIPVDGTVWRPIAPTATITRTAAGVASISFASISASAQIRYTTDGSIPNAISGTLVAQNTPITVTGSSLVTYLAVAVSGGRVSTDVSTMRVKPGNSITLRDREFDTEGRVVQGLMSAVRYEPVTNLFWRTTENFRVKNGWSVNTPLLGALSYSSPDLVTWQVNRNSAVFPPLVRPDASWVSKNTVERPARFEFQGATYQFAHTAPDPPALDSNYPTYNSSQNMIHRAATPNGPFVPVRIENSLSGGILDFSIFVDTDGTTYLIATVNNTFNGPQPLNVRVEIGKIVSDGSGGINVQFVGVLDSRGGREAPIMLKRKGVYYFTSSPTAGYVGSSMTYKRGNSIADLISQAANAGISPYYPTQGFPNSNSNGTPFFGQLASAVQLPNTFDAAGEKGWVVTFDDWNVYDLWNGSYYSTCPVHFDADGKMYFRSQDITWTLATAFQNTIPADASANGPTGKPTLNYTTTKTGETADAAQFSYVLSANPASATAITVQIQVTDNSGTGVFPLTLPAYQTQVTGTGSSIRQANGYTNIQTVLPDSAYTVGSQNRSLFNVSGTSAVAAGNPVISFQTTLRSIDDTKATFLARFSADRILTNALNVDVQVTNDLGTSIVTKTIPANTSQIDLVGTSGRLVNAYDNVQTLQANANYVVGSQYTSTFAVPGTTTAVGQLISDDDPRWTLNGAARIEPAPNSNSDNGTIIYVPAGQDGGATIQLTDCVGVDVSFPLYGSNAVRYDLTVAGQQYSFNFIPTENSNSAVRQPLANFPIRFPKGDYTLAIIGRANYNAALYLDNMRAYS